MCRFLLLTAFLPGAAFAVGPDTTSPPSTPACEDGYVYDSETDTCVQASNSLIDDAERTEALRQYAYAGDTDAAMRVLASHSDQSADIVLTYRGFLARTTGDMASAMTWYKAALSTNPDNILARSYMGQGLVKTGDLVGAKHQHDEIMARGGAGTWAEVALAEALMSGTTFND